MKTFLGICILTLASAAAFGQVYAGERFSAAANTNVSLNGGGLILKSTTAFTGSCLPGNLAPRAPQVIAGTCYSIGPAALAVKLTVTVSYQTSALPSGTSASALRLYQVIGDEWTPVTGSTVSTSTSEVTGTLSATGTFAVLSGTPSPFEGDIYYRTSFSGDATLYRFLTATVATNSVGEPLANLVGLSGQGFPTEMIVSPQRNGLGVARTNPAGTTDFCTSSIDGSNLRWLSGPYANVNGACFSSDGSTIYASVVKAGATAWGILKINVATGAYSTLHSGGSSSGPAYGNGVIAFADGQTITTISSAGTVKQFTSPSSDGIVDNGIDVSLDGTKLAWVTDDGAIYTATSTGGSIKDLVSGGFNGYACSSPHWNPEGTMISCTTAGSGGILVPISNPTAVAFIFPGLQRFSAMFWR